ncbi:hypothetical protein CLOM_g11915, partial [Closterium sp. NIES-68]
MAAAELARLTEIDLSDRGIVELKQEVFSATLLPNLARINLSRNPLPLSLLAPIDASRSSVLLPLASLPSLRSVQIDLEGPFPFDPYETARTLPHLSSLNGALLSSFTRGGSWMFPRLPACQPGTPLVDRVLHAMWRHVCSYKLATETQLDESAVWYVMDEFGSAFRHSDRPNFRCSPFLFLPDGSFASAVSYSLVWPVAAVQPGEECTRTSSLGWVRSSSGRPSYPPTSSALSSSQQQLQSTLKPPLSLATAKSDNKGDKEAQRGGSGGSREEGVSRVHGYSPCHGQPFPPRVRIRGQPQRGRHYLDEHAGGRCLQGGRGAQGAEGQGRGGAVYQPVSVRGVHCDEAPPGQDDSA